MAETPVATGLRLNTDSDPANLAPVRKAVEKFCMECGMAAGCVDDVGLCVNEAMANVTRHAYGGRTDRPVVVSAEHEAGRIVLRIRDWGSGVDPSTLPARKPDPMRPGGLGLICLKKLMDGVAYVPQGDGMLLEMVKRIDAADPHSGDDAAR